MEYGERVQVAVEEYRCEDQGCTPISFELEDLSRVIG
jgi:hypothetical protein